MKSGMKEHMMRHLADALRNFRSKLYMHFVWPNIGKPSKLKVVPKQYEPWSRQIGTNLLNTHFLINSKLYNAQIMLYIFIVIFYLFF